MADCCIQGSALSTTDRVQKEGTCCRTNASSRNAMKEPKTYSYINAPEKVKGYQKSLVFLENPDSVSRQVLMVYWK
jgi:hypothetical protein